ncbi:hypothetical protein DXV75_13655 [Alteromonas aestuariivivens]|uniref:Uncharacterized protein n=1 Tax=Alteromonas aestuariivivens TaxID=1938339 RepID=A0A3D8M489_9ALTE|nr:hypothetical protein [Alteromonas aestuariivivens]RDV24466.1 hypothetical protein DXV75_13655 [Alteromonas aestuariivivens]
MMRKSALVIVAGLLQAGSAASSELDEFESAYNGLCQKIKQCAFEHMQEEQGVSQEMRSMVDGMLSAMCENMMKFTESDVEQYQELARPAASCMNSMTELPCSKLLEDRAVTAECKAFEAEAEKYKNPVQ